MFNQITKCIKAHDVHNNNDYTICRFYQQLVQLLTRFYQFDFFKPTLYTVPLIDSPVATITIFDFYLIIVCGGTRSGAQWQLWNDGGRHGHWGTSWLALASCNLTKLDFHDRWHIVDRPYWKWVTDNIAARIWDEMTATEVHIPTPWRTLHYRGQIGTRLSINCAHMWNLGSASGVTWRIVDVVVKQGQYLSLIVFACGS